MNLKIAGLLAAFVVMAVALAAGVHSSALSLTHAIAFFTLLGGATVVYAYPVSGSTAPTAAQMNGGTTLGVHNTVTGTLFMLDSETTITIVHNFGNLGTGQGEGSTEPTKFFPIPIIYQQNFSTTSTTALMPQLSYVVSSTNVVVTKAVSTSGTGTYVFAILRPFAPTR